MDKKIDCFLLVDDNEDDNFIHKRVISKSGRVDKVRIALDGLEALDYLESQGKFMDQDKNPRPNIILLDINMPKMNGFEFLEAYKKLDESKLAEVCLIMLTTSKNPQDLEKAQKVSYVSDFLVKPLTKEKLDQIIDQYWADQS